MGPLLLLAVASVPPTADWTWTEGPAALVVHDADQPGRRLRLRLGQRLRITLRIEGEETLQVNPVETLTRTPGWEWRAEGSARARKRKTGQQLWEQTFSLDPFLSPGNAEVALEPLRYRPSAGEPAREVRWPVLALEVYSSVEQPDPEAVRDIPGIESLAPAPQKDRRWLWATLGVVGLLAMVAGGYGLWRSQRHSVTPPTPAEHALRSLEHLEAQATADEPGWQHTRVSAVVRRFVDEQFHLPAVQRTTDELWQVIAGADALPEPLREPLRELLERCDLARFSGIAPGVAERQQVVEQARAFIHRAIEPGASPTGKN